MNRFTDTGVWKGGKGARKRRDDERRQKYWAAMTAAAATEDQSESRDGRADIVSATGELSDTHDDGVRAVELDTAEAVPRCERAEIVPTATIDQGDNQDVIGVETYELDSPDGATAIDPRDHKEDIRIRSQNLLDSLRRGRKDCYICCQGLHDKMGVGCHSKKYRL